MDEFKILIDEIKPEYILLSSEHFSRISGDDIRSNDLFKYLALRGYSITIVAMIREQIGLIQSSYTEGVVSFFNHISFRDYIKNALCDVFFDVNIRFTKWSRLPGIKFVPLPYVRSQRMPLPELILLAGGCHLIWFL